MGNDVSTPRNLPRRTNKSKRLSPEENDFEGAGCIFTNGTTLLAGYQKKKEKSIISGLGGRRKDEETFMETALRETIEELFDIKDIDPVFLKKLTKLLRPRDVIFMEVEGWGIYITVIYSYSDLERLLDYTHKKLLDYTHKSVKRSPLYKTFPDTICKLLLNRIIPTGSPPEITHLTLVPLDSTIANATISPDFLEDITKIGDRID
uniref:Nudix hydrolase domain-containing protein n=1 Tax=viral metagenome TaxID=1070528 RepID=A0A6C0K4I2_9ZZZZ